MYQVSHLIDWMTITDNQFPEGQTCNNSEHAALIATNFLLGLVPNSEGFFEPRSPQRFYAYAFEDVNLGVEIQVSNNLSVQGVKAVFPGKCALPPAARIDVLRNAQAIGARVTRLDYAIDIFNAPYLVRHLKETWEKHRRADRRQTRFINGHGADTFEIGSRSSERFFRCYNKAAEQKIAHPWIRLETEYKGQLAQLAAHMAVSRLEDLAYDVAGSLQLQTTWIDYLLNDIFKSGGAKMRSPRQAESDRERWLKTQVLAAYVRLRDEDPAAGERVLQAFIQASQIPF